MLLHSLVTLAPNPEHGGPHSWQCPQLIGAFLIVMSGGLSAPEFEDFPRRRASPGFQGPAITSSLGCAPAFGEDPVTQWASGESLMNSLTLIETAVRLPADVASG
jgi:hypothetical protein